MWVSNGEMIIEANVIRRAGAKIIARNGNATLEQEYSTEKEAAEILARINLALTYNVKLYDLPKRKDAGVQS